MSHLRSLAIALVVLGLSAGAVFATKTLSDVANFSHDTATRTAAVLAPVTTADSSTGTDASTGTDDTTGTDTHGAFVSAAAHLSFDELKAACAGFDGKNKGAYISAIARGILLVTLPTDATAGTTVDTSTGTTTPTITCTLAPVPVAPTATTGTAPAPLHGSANAAAKRAQHPGHRHG